MRSTGRFRLADDVVVQPAAGEALLVKLNDEDMFGLNATGAEIVARVVSGVSLDTAIDQLAAEYEGDRAAIAADVHDLVSTLVARGLLVEAA
jgi:hypothetical protein